MTLTEQIRDAIFEELVREHYTNFTPAKLPTERTLADRYQVSLVTVRRAIDELERSQYVQRRQGSGTYVIDRRTLDKRYSFALTVPSNPSSPFYMALAGRIEPELRRLGHSVQLFVVEDAGMLLRAFERQNWRPDAIIICGFLVDLPLLAATKIPHVLAGGEGYQCADSVVYDLRAGAFRAVSHLIGLGHRRILYLSNLDRQCKLATRINQEFIFEMSSRYQGYCDALEATGLPLDRNLVQLVGESKRNSYLAVKQMLDAKTFDATAIFAATDMLAEGAATALNEAGIIVPADVSLVGCDNLADNRELLLPLTSLDLRLDDVAAAAIRLLLDRIENPAGHEEYRSISIIPRLVNPAGSCRQYDLIPKLIH